MASSRLSLRYVRRFTTSAGDATTTVEAAAPSPVKISASKAKTSLRDPDKALEIDSNVSHHDASTGSSRFAQEVTARRYSDIETLLESQMNDAKIDEELFFSTVIRSHGRASKFGEAMRMFKEMDRDSTPRSALSFNTLLYACLHSRKYKVPQLFDKIPKRCNDIIPDKISYCILIKSYCDSGSHEKAIEIMRQIMEGKGMEEATSIALTTILNSLYKKGEVEVAENLWNEVVKKGCEIDNAAYNVRIMNAQKESPERVMELIQEMSTMGLKPDTNSYNYLMTTYCEKGMLDEAKKVYEGLQGNSCAPNAATFRTLIFHLCYSGLYEQAYAVFKDSVYMHKIPDFDTLQHLVVYMHKFPDFNILKQLVVGLVRKKEIDEAKGLIRTAKKKFPPSFLNAWKKLEEELEEELRLVSKTDASSSSA